MAASATLNGFGVFADEVYTSTDLNRRSGEVLNHARERPVTISRNNEQFALLKREQAARLVRMADRTTRFLNLLSELHFAIAGEAPSPSYHWLKVFEKDDLEKMCGEILQAVRKSVVGGEWDEIEAVIHEWHESALVASGGVLDSAMFQDPKDESPLPHPKSVPVGEELAGTECVTD
jgi:hypothetical protein